MMVMQQPPVAQQAPVMMAAQSQQPAVMQQAPGMMSGSQPLPTADDWKTMMRFQSTQPASDDSNTATSDVQEEQDASAAPHKKALFQQMSDAKQEADVATANDTVTP